MEDVVSEAKSYTDAPTVIPDIAEFKSVVDGTVITGRRALREHNKRNGVVQTLELAGEGDKARRERESFYLGDKKFGQRERIEAFKQAYDKHNR